MRILLRVVLGLVGLLVVAVAAVYALGYRETHKDYPVTAATLEIPQDSASIREGERLARIRGCFGCHGADLAGEDFFNEPLVAHIITANLTDLARRYTTEQLDVAIRHGLAADGRNLVVMPSDMYYHLSDRDVSMIIAFLKQVPAAPDSLAPTRIGPLGYFGLLTGKFQTTPSLIDHAAPRLDPGEPATIARGRYLATTTCTECHGARFEGGDDTPSLSVVAGYSEEQFRTLLRTARPLDGRELGLMKSVALGRTVHFDDAEIGALYAFLRTLAAGGTP